MERKLVSRMTIQSRQRLEAGTTIMIGSELMKVPGSEGQLFTLYELLDENSEHMGWEWQESYGITATWIKAELPPNSKYVAVFLDRTNFERELKNGMRPILEDSSMPVFVAIECEQEDQKCPGSDGKIYLHN